MTAVRFLVLGIIGTLVSWGTWIVVLTQINPESSRGVAPALFFSSLWLALAGTATVIGFLARHLFEREGVPYRQMAVAIRQAVNVSTLAVVVLALQAGGALNVWTGLLSLVMAVCIEAFYQAGQARHPSHHQSYQSYE